jgi:hypothetical protein
VVNRSRGLPKKQVKEPPDLLARGKICVQNGVEWSCGMLVDLSTLALLAVSAHGCHSLQTTIQNSVPDPDPNLRIRIHMFLGLPDPDPLVRGMDPDPDPHVFGPPGSGSISQRYRSGSGSTGFWTSRIRILLSSSKISKKNLDSFCFVTSFGLFIFVK